MSVNKFQVTVLGKRGLLVTLL